MDNIEIEFLAICTNSSGLHEFGFHAIIHQKVYKIKYINPLYGVFDENGKVLCYTYNYKKYFTDLAIWRENKIKNILDESY